MSLRKFFYTGILLLLYYPYSYIPKLFIKYTCYLLAIYIATLLRQCSSHYCLYLSQSIMFSSLTLFSFVAYSLILFFYLNTSSKSRSFNSAKVMACPWIDCRVISYDRERLLKIWSTWTFSEGQRVLPLHKLIRTVTIDCMTSKCFSTDWPSFVFKDELFFFQWWIFFWV